MQILKSVLMLSIIVPLYLENLGELLSKICLSDILIDPSVIFPVSTLLVKLRSISIIGFSNYGSNRCLSNSTFCIT